MLHLHHRLLETDEQRMGDDGVADVQFVHAGNRRHRLDVVVMQAVTGVDDQAMGQAARHAVADPRQLPARLVRVMGIGVTAGMQLDGRRADTPRGFYLPFLGIDEQ